MDILERIKQDHDQVKGLLEKMLQTTPRAAKSRQELSDKLIALMMPHNKSEEKVFYPRLLEVKSAHEHALEALEEHHVAEFLLKEIGRMRPEDERWKAKISVFKETIEHHIEEEEGEIFSQARQAFGADQLASMGESFLRAKERTPLRRAA